MKNLITKKHKHLLWRDEIRDTFLILKWCEIYRYSKKELRLYIWSLKKRSELFRKGLIFNDRTGDVGFYIFNAKVVDLPQILALKPVFRKRPDIKGKWLKSREELLGHKILFYKPKKFYGEI